MELRKRKPRWKSGKQGHKLLRAAELVFHSVRYPRSGSSIVRVYPFLLHTITKIFEFAARHIGVATIKRPKPQVTFFINVAICNGPLRRLVVNAIVCPAYGCPL